MSKSADFSSESLYKSACFYQDLGWSVIPLYGDKKPEKAKAAAVPWTAYQREIAPKETLAEWFLSGAFSCLGIVCGPVSQLVVLDFDDAAFAAAFERHCPDLTETLTVRSGGRGLPHYYYHADHRTKVLNKRLAGADLQGQGRYVVAPPSVIQGKAWRVIHGVEPLSLSQADLQRIESFLETYAYVQAENSVSGGVAMPEFGPTRPITDNLSLSVEGWTAKADLSPEKAVRWYQGKARQGSRNMALFSTALVMRQAGWSEAKTCAVLAPVHSLQVPLKAHVFETVEQRRNEAEKTIHSAYRYRLNTRVKVQKTQLPNSLREHLLQQGFAAVARVLEGLLAQGISAGKTFTERSASSALSVLGIGRRSVLKALQILRIKSENNTGKQTKTSKKTLKKCLFVTGAKRVRLLNHVGVVPRYYTMPDMVKLCRLFGVAGGYSDTLPVEALHSPKQYRAALQEALFKRRPGQYSRQWLASRLGVSVWTSRRYDRAIGTHIQPRYDEQVIHWANLGVLEDVLAPANGVFLETPTGERYPPLRGIAHRLLNRFHQVKLKRRRWNYYVAAGQIAEEYPVDSVQESVPNAPKTRDNTEKVAQGPVAAPTIGRGALPPLMDAEEIEGFWLCPECLKFHICAVPPKHCEKCGAGQWQLIPKAIWQDVERCKAWWGALKRAKRAAMPKRSVALERPTIAPTIKPYVGELLPLPAGAKPWPSLESVTEQAAEKLYQQVYAMTPDHSFTRAQTRQLIDQFGLALVVSVTGKLYGRKLHNAAGFVINTLRDLARPDNLANNGEAFIASLYESGMARYFANLDEGDY